MIPLLRAAHLNRTAGHMVATADQPIGGRRPGHPPRCAVRRLAGASRTQTAVEAARESASLSTVVIADAGLVFDALIAAASTLGPPLLADPAGGLPDEALALLQSSGTRQAVLIGTAGSNARLAQQLNGVEVEDLGVGRPDSLSASVAQGVHRGPADGVLLASGASWPDTLTAARWPSGTGSPCCWRCPTAARTGRRSAPTPPPLFGWSAARPPCQTPPCPTDHRPTDHPAKCGPVGG